MISVQMTYCNLETEEIRRFVQEFSVKELKSWFDELTEQYCKWCEMQVKWKTCRQESIHACVFPFPYREGQKQLAAAVYRTIAHRKKLFIQAPTGVGKTISTVFPTVKAVGENLGEKIFYLTAKTVTRTVAEEAFSVLKGKGLRYKVLTLTAKEKICPLEEAKCNPIECPYAKGHYDRVNEAVFEMLNETEVFDREAIWKQSEKWKVCPYEMTLDLSMWVDAVICDYNYVFDPNARLKRFFGDNIKGEYLFLIDEAHNLVERGREMYSASLCKERFLEIRRLLKSKSRKISRTLEKCNRVLLEWKRECEDYQIRKNISELILPLMNLCGELEDFLEEVMRAGTSKLWLDVKNITIDGKSTEEGREASARACERACEIIEEMGAQNFCEFIVTGNATKISSSSPVTIWQRSLAVGSNAGWMSFRNPADYISYGYPWANLSTENLYFEGKTVNKNGYSVQKFLDAGLKLSVYNADLDVDMDYYLAYKDKLYAICTNYPRKLLGKWN